MKKVLLWVAVAVFFTTVGYAQTPKPLKAPLIERSQGKIESLQKPDVAAGNFGKFILTQTDGKKKDFDLIAKTHFFSPNSSPLNFADFKKGDQVTVLYVVTLKGLNDAITVTQVK